MPGARSDKAECHAHALANSFAQPERRRLRAWAYHTRALWVVAAVALLINGLSLSASQLWAVPDSVRYLEMAVDVAERFDFGSESFVLRTPGYPLLLAGIFVLFGSHSTTAVLVVQHGMVVATALLTALIGWHLTRRASVALVSGVFCACSLQVTAFANVLMPEAAYTFALITCVYFLVRYHAVGGLRFLALASLMAGVSYQFRPTGLTVVALCVVAALHRAIAWHGQAEPRNEAQLARVDPGAERGQTGLPIPPYRNRVTGVLLGVVVAIAPMLAVVVPYLFFNAAAHGGQVLNHSMGFALYNRAAYYDRLPLDSTDSAALTEIREVLAEARRIGALGAHADAGLSSHVCQAYRAVRKASAAQAGETIRRAAWDLVRAHPRRVADRTLRYAAWMLLVPDSTYRFQPGGAVGHSCKRAVDADIFDIGTYQTDAQPYGEKLRALARYVPLRKEPRTTTPLWTAIARWFHRHVERGPAILGLGDSPYQAFVLLCLVGGVCSLWTPGRMTWLLVGGVVATQVVGSAFFGASMQRYGVPIHPLMNLYAALVLVGVARAAVGLIRHARRWNEARRCARSWHVVDSARP